MPFHRKAPKNPEAGPRLFWAGFRPLYDYWGNELKRYYKLETLASATAHMIKTKDRFLVPTVQSVLGPLPVRRLMIELFQEGRYQLIFRVLAENARGNRAAFGLVVAKNHQECSKVAQQEHQNLRWLHDRAPKWVVKPYQGGMIYLPDRHLRKECGRDIYAYLTQWLDAFDELGVNENLQFYTNVEKRHTFTKIETDVMKRDIAEIIATSYDANAEKCMTMPEIASGDFVVKRMSRGPHRLQLIACRRIQERVSPPKLIRMILTTAWDWGGRRFSLAPESPELFFEGLTKAVGGETARDWIRRYLAGLSSNPQRGPAPDYVEALRAIMMK